jgi:hypothetical protein
MPPARTQAGAIRGPALGTGVAGGDGDVELDAVGAPRQPLAARIGHGRPAHVEPATSGEATLVHVTGRVGAATMGPALYLSRESRAKER